MVEPRTILRALCPTRAGELHVLGADGGFWERLRRALGEPSPGAGATALHEPIDRRREGFAGVAGDLFTSGERVLVAVADVERRRQGLEQIVAGLAPGPMAVTSWAAVAADPELAAGYDHLVALDPPPGGLTDRLLHQGPRAQMAWGPAEAEFALQVWRAELDLRPALACVYRALRELPGRPEPEALRAALEGDGRYPRSPESCARLISVLTELALIEFTAEPPACRVVDAERANLDSSPTYRACSERLAAIEHALAAELPDRAPARAA